MKKWYLLILLGLYASISLAQKTDHLIKGYVYNEITKSTLSNVSITWFGDTGKGTTTNRSGYFELTADSLPFKIRLSYIGYESQIIEINTTSVEIFLNPKPTLLPEISVTAIRKIDTVFHEPINVVDFDFLEKNLVLLVYVNVFEKYKLYLLDEKEEPVAQLALTDRRPNRLFKSCAGMLYLLTDLGAYKIGAGQDSISLDKKISLEEFENTIRPCVLATDSLVYFNEYFYQGQAMCYFAYHRNQPLKRIDFPMIQDERNIDLLIKETGNRFPRSGDVWEPEVETRLIALRHEPYGLKGMMKIFYPKLYAPLVPYDSLLCLFNHQESEIQYFDKTGVLLSSIPIQYHRYKKWKKQIIYDAETRVAYTGFDTRWGEQLCPINLKDGSLGEAIPIDLAFLENLKIRDGYLYFLHRDPYRGGRKRMLKKVGLAD